MKLVDVPAGDDVFMIVSNWVTQTAAAIALSWMTAQAHLAKV